MTIKCSAGALALAAAIFSAGANGAAAQAPGSPPPGAAFPGPPGAGPPGPKGELSGPPRGAPGPASGPPPGIQLTEAQKVVAALPPPVKAGVFPQPPVPADAPKPAADPRDFQGVWYHDQPLETRTALSDMYGLAAPVSTTGAEVIKRRVMSAEGGKPYANASSICLPPGPQWQHDLNFPFQIVQGKTWVEFIFEEYHGRWNISLDPAASPLPAGKEYQGRSVGHWEGDTLIVESTDFKQALWLDVDGTPLSADGKLIQRIRKVDDGRGKPFLEIITTIDDPKYYTETWSIVRRFAWHPNLAVFKEYNCEEQVGDPGVSADAGLVTEPED
jgi:hypothetical protein